MLKHTVEAVRRQARPVEVIVHDNGSTDDDTISALAELERNGVRVYRRNAIQAADQLNETDLTVREYFSDWAEPARYAVTDCDIDMSTASPHAIEVFDELLNRFREIETVGPMLRIRDVNPSYVLFAELMNRHISQFWEREPVFIATSHGQAAFIDTRIDTTFSLHRAGEPFRRGKRALRVYEPYEAAHLDWYPKWSDDKVFADTSSARISHWTNREFRTSRPGVSLRYDRFRAVIAQADGGLEVYDEILRPPPERQSLLGRALRMLSTLAPGSIRRGLKRKGA
jgi:glycosyltransferase involved in cell wall biosynthesis